MPEQTLSFCVVVPMYNEEANAERCVRMVSEVLGGQAYRTALIVVDDGSRDQTGKILRRLSREFPGLRLVMHERNAGYGGALQTGVKTAISEGFDYVLFMDSDLTNDPKCIPKFVEKMFVGYDVIKGSRYVEGGAMVGVPTHRVWISVIGNKIARALYGIPISDCTNGFRAVKTGILSRMSLRESGFAVIMEELYHATYLAKSFCEVPYTLTSRQSGQGGSSFSYRPKIFFQYLKYGLKSFWERWRPSRRRHVHLQSGGQQEG
ncbi:MAG: glycosyltransferase [Nitrospirota bacterium]